MKFWLALLNDSAVSIFGSVLAASFSNALQTRKNRIRFWCSMAAILCVQGCICFLWDAEVLRLFFPLAVHLPLSLLLFWLSGKMLWSVICVLFAYLCCQLRRWLALFAVVLLSGGDVLQDFIELIITLPILFALLHFVAPAIRKMAKSSAKLQLIFGIIPAVYYVFDYATVVYTDILTSGSSVVVEFMPLVCCVSYLLFLMYHSAEEEKQLRMQQIQNNLNLQLKQSVKEISALRESQILAARYRHDLRHHLQYVASCIENGQGEHAQTYISDICREIEAHKHKRYCENETVNLIFSSFDGRASEEGITMKIHGALPAELPIAETDLCVLLSNALENAIHACRSLTAKTKTSAVIDVCFYERDDKFFLQLTNPYEGEIHFKKGIPVSGQPGHGIGVQSICAIVEHYGGIYSFRTENKTFLLRLYL